MNGGKFAIGKKYVHVYSAAPAAILACTFMEPLFTSATTGNKIFFKDISCFLSGNYVNQDKTAFCAKCDLCIKDI